MYFPYLRGKQYELLALRDLIEYEVLNSKITPIIEPVKSNLGNLLRALNKFIEKGLPFVLIINPQYGDLKDQPLSIKNEIINKILNGYNRNYYLGYIINEHTRPDELDNFLSAYANNRIYLIHYARFQRTTDLTSILRNHRNIEFNAIIEKRVGVGYKEKIAQNTSYCLIEDNFIKKNNNAEYGEADFFSSLYKTYRDDEFDAFGDFLILPDEYYDSGGPAYAVALHLSEVNDEEEIWIRHFVSDSNGTPVDPGGKFLEALRKLIRYIDANRTRFEFSNACIEYRKLFRTRHFPGLGAVKKLSLEHHIELISTLI